MKGGERWRRLQKMASLRETMAAHDFREALHEEREAKELLEEGRARVREEEARWKEGLLKGAGREELLWIWQGAEGARKAEKALFLEWQAREALRREKERRFHEARRDLRTYERLAEKAEAEAQKRTLDHAQKALDEAAILRWKGGDA